MTSYITTARPSSAKRRGANTAPVNFDPADCPILAVHYFGLERPRPVGPFAAEVVADLQRRRHVQKVHRLGDRVFGELLAEIGAEALETTGGDRFPPAPIHGVER